MWPVFDLKPDEVNDIAHKLALSTDGLGLEQVVVRARIPNPQTGELRDTVMRISAPGDAGLLMTFRPFSKLQPLKPLTEYDQKVVKMRQRGLIYPYEIIKMLTPVGRIPGANFRPANSSSTISMPTTGWCRSIVRPGKTSPTSSSASFATLPPSIPKA